MWTIEKVRQLTELWSKGLSASQIGQKMNLTRNTILGKVHRLRLPGRKSIRLPLPETKRPRIAPRPVKSLYKVQPRPFCKPPRVEQSKRQLYAMLAEAVRNTAALQEAM